VIFALLGWLCYLPFYMGFQSQLGGVLPNLLFPTRLSQFLLMFGPFLVVVVFLFALLSLEPGRPVVGTGDAQGQVTELRPDVRYPILRQVLRLLPWTIGLPLLLVVLIILGFAILPQGRAYAETLLQDPAVAANVGGHSLAQLAGLVARVRLATPWTFLLLAGLIAWSGAILWARLSAKGAVQQGSGQAAPANGLTQSDLFAVLMVGLALLLTLSVEFVYLRDLFGTRMNTVFKFYYQAWVLLGLAAAYGLSRLAVATTPRGLKVPGLVLAGLLIAGCLCYPVAAIPSKADGFQAEPTLDGLAYLRRYNPGDMAAIEWLRANVPPTAVVLEASGGSYSPEGAGRVSMATGNPTLLGWDFHEMQWRGKAYNDLTAGRLEALERIYRTARPEELPGLLARWGIDYVYVGALERNKYGIGDASLARFDRSLKLVYDRDGVKIYAAR
jgi:YYY domain-containing protein